MATLRTNLTPDIPLDVTRGGESPLLRLLQPAVDLGGAIYAPAGEPVAGLGPFVFFGVLGLATYGAFTLARRIR